MTSQGGLASRALGQRQEHPFAEGTVEFSNGRADGFSIRVAFGHLVETIRGRDDHESSVAERYIYTV